jgi:hypothetical protein
MGTALAKRSIRTAVAENPFPFFDADAFRAQVTRRLRGYRERTGGKLVVPSLTVGAGEILRVHLEDIPFPDGPGLGKVLVVAYRAYGRLKVAVVFDHDRLFRTLDGSSAGRLYLHDYSFVRSYGPEHPPTIEEIDQALQGVERARHSVRRRNAANPSALGSLGRIRVAVRCTHSVPAHGAGDEPDAKDRPVGHRRAELLAALEAEKKRSVKIRIRRRPDDGSAPATD